LYKKKNIIQEKSKKFISFIGIIFFLIGCAYVLFYSSLSKELAESIDDKFIYQRMYFENSHQNNVVIIKIDNKTLDSFQSGDIKTSYI
jgi:uncharacterized membrane protein SpoIIM required for sporulation